MKRPAIITVLAVFQFIGAACLLLMGLGTMLFSLGGRTEPGALFGGAIFAAIGALELICGLGLLNLKSYGRTLQIAFAFLGLLAVPIGTIISVLILVYLFKPGVKLLFSERPAADLTPEELAQVEALSKGSGVMVALVVVGVVGSFFVAAVIAAVAIPGLLRARTAGNEAQAIGSLRTIMQAELTYLVDCTPSGGGYAVSLEDLAKPPVAGSGSAFVDADLGRSGVVRSGYRFTVSRDAGPEVTDVGTAAATCNGSTGQPASSYFAYAEPETPGTTGYRYFAVDAKGTIYESPHPIANPIVPSSNVTPIR